MFLFPKADGGGDRSPWGDFWFTPVPFRGGVLDSNPESAMRLTAVYACVRILAEGVATLPFTLNTVAADGSRTRVTDHWLYRLLAGSPNDRQNAFEFREMMQAHLALRGNCYAQIIGNSKGEAEQLIPIHPDRVQVLVTDNGGLTYLVQDNTGAKVPLSSYQMFHMRGLSFDGVLGINPIAAARESVQLGLAAQSYGARFFENDARPGGYLEHPGNFATAEARNLFREQWQAMQSGANRQKTAVLEYGVKFHEVKVSNEDAQFLETRKMQISEIARLFRVPPHMIGDLERATNSNIEQQSLDYIMFTLTPWLIRWEHAIKATFLGEDSPLTIEFPVTSLLRGDSTARTAYYTGGINAGWLTRNEARIQESLKPLPGLDEPILPLNMREESDDPDDPTAGKEPPNVANRRTVKKPAPDQAPEPAAPPPSPPKKAERLQAIAFAAAERVARKEAQLVADCPEPLKRGDLLQAFFKHTDFIAAALGIHRALAASYCASQIDALLSGEIAFGTGYEAFARQQLYALAIGDTP